MKTVKLKEQCYADRAKQDVWEPGSQRRGDDPPSSQGLRPQQGPLEQPNEEEAYYYTHRAAPPAEDKARGSAEEDENEGSKGHRHLKVALHDKVVHHRATLT